MFFLRDLCKISTGDLEKLQKLCRDVRQEKVTLSGCLKQQSLNFNCKESSISENVFTVNDNIFDENNVLSRFVESDKNDIITAPNNEKIFVNAGPGSGKTYTLIQRINNLVTTQHVEASGIVVLCYTNAAVNEVRERLREFIHTGKGSRKLFQVDVRTFHSFAFWLCDQLNILAKSPDTDDGFKVRWHSAKSAEYRKFERSTYDRVLLSVSSVLENKTIDDVIFEGWKHLIIDEVQDITNNLANLVLSIIKVCMGYDSIGITIFGDSCQAIFDYTKKFNNTYKLSSEDFYEMAVRMMEGKAKFYSLNFNHRQTLQLQSFTNLFRTAILKKDFKGMQNAVKKIINFYPVIYNFSGDDFKELQKSGKICFLTRSNLEVLRVSSELKKRKVGHVVRSKINDDDDNCKYEPWIAAVLMNHVNDKITRQEFIEKIRLYDSQLDAINIWERCCSVLGIDCSGNSIEVKKLLSAIKQSGKGNTVFRGGINSNIIVSDIHMSKGREYDSVVILKSFVKNLFEKDMLDIDEYKVLYVAFTRPKAEIRFMDLPTEEIFGYREGSLMKLNEEIVYKRYFCRTSKKMLFLPHIDNPVINGCSVVYERVRDIKLMDSVEIMMDASGFYYLVTVDRSGKAKKICVIPKNFINSYRKIFDIRELPKRFIGLSVSGIYTIILSTDELRGLSEATFEKIRSRCPNMLWFYVEISGICKPV